MSATSARDLEAGPPNAPILWHSNAPWVGTGYGTQTALFAPLLAEMLGHRLAFSAFFGLQGSQLGWVARSGNAYPVYPGGRELHGNDVVAANAAHHFKAEGGLVILLTDPWVMEPSVMSRLPLMAWVPVDHEPLMPRTHEWFKASAAIPVAMSKFGKHSLEFAGHKGVQYVPHGIDTDIFSPASPADRAEAREEYGIPQSAFCVGMVAANKGVPSRKSFSQAITAFGIFRARHADAVLYLHTRLEDPDGEDILAMAELCKVRALASDQYGMVLGFPQRAVASLMSTFDVLLNPATGEGFGVPLIEAQGVGTPCITTDFSAMPEVAPVAEGNWTVGGQEIITPFNARQVTPSVEEIVDALESAYADSEEERLARRVGVAAWAHSEYDAVTVTEKYWQPVIAESADIINWRRQRMTRYSS